MGDGRSLNAAPRFSTSSRSRVRRVVLATVVLSVAAVHPPHGLGIDICPPRLLSGLPCPGCGITRSVSCTVRGMFSEAIAFNPFGPVFVLATVLIGASALMPSTMTARIARRFKWARSSSDRMLRILAAALVAFGLLRIAIQLVVSQPL